MPAAPLQVRDVLNVFNHLKQKRAGALNFAALDIYSQKYTTLKERLIRAEREILKELGFVLYTEHPHKFILNYCKLLTLERDTPRLAQQAWNFINDSQRTNVCFKFAPEVSATRGLALPRCSSSSICTKFQARNIWPTV